jgi:excisionase family DNA binding protein
VATYSSAEAAEEVGCRERWLVEQVRAGRFPARKVGRSWRFTEQDLADIFEACANGFRRPAGTPDAVVKPISTGLTPRSRRKLQDRHPTRRKAPSA